jgi:Uma2 family endonuclease
MAVTQRRLSLAEFLALPEEEPALEYEDGVVTQKVSPKNRHSRLQGRLVTHLNHCAEPRRIAVAFPELRVTFAGRSCVPDVAVIRWERLPLDERGDLTDDFLEPPDVAIEILSPDQSVRSLRDRCRWYVEHGVSLALLVDPIDRSVGECRPGAGERWLLGTDVIDFGPVIPGCALTVNELFAAIRFR